MSNVQYVKISTRLPWGFEHEEKNKHLITMIGSIVCNPILGITVQITEANGVCFKDPTSGKVVEKAYSQFAVDFLLEGEEALSTIFIESLIYHLAQATKHQVFGYAKDIENGGPGQRYVTVKGKIQYRDKWPRTF